MALETISQAQLNTLEHQVRELLITLKKTKVQNKVLIEALQAFEHTLGTNRRERFDAVNSEYKSY